MPQPPAAIIFDMDETLAATSLLWRKAESDLLDTIGHPWSPVLALQFKGMNTADVAATIHRVLRPSLPVEACQEMLRNSLFEAFENGPIKPKLGALDCVHALSKIYPLAVASGSPLPLVELTMDALGLRKSFRALLSSESVRFGKPAPDIFLAAAKKLGVPPARCLVIEDTLFGTQAALAAGMACFNVPTASHKEIAAIATRVFSSLEEITPDVVASALT